MKGPFVFSHFSIFYFTCNSFCKHIYLSHTFILNKKTYAKYHLSHDVTSGSEITSCIKIDKPLSVTCQALLETNPGNQNLLFGRSAKTL